MSNSTKRAIVIADIVLFFILLNTLPFETKATQGLSILIFIAVLWLTEALHTTITAILIPVFAVATGLMSTKSTLYGFSDPTIFLFGSNPPCLFFFSQKAQFFLVLETFFLYFVALLLAFDYVVCAQP